MKHPHHSCAANALCTLAVDCLVAASLAAETADENNQLTPIAYEPTHVLLQPTLWHQVGWQRVGAGKQPMGVRFDTKREVLIGRTHDRPTS